MIHNIKEIHELYQQSHLAEIKEIAIKADRLGLKEMADKIFALHFEVKKSLAKTATHFLGVKKLIKHIEITSRYEEIKAAVEDEISEMRFEKGIPIPGIDADSIPKPELGNEGIKEEEEIINGKY